MKHVTKLGAAGALMALGALAFSLPLPYGVAVESETLAATEAASAPEVMAPEPIASEATAREPVVEVEAEAAASAVVLETFTGSASYYSDRFEGRRTASGVRFRQANHWAAHRTLPFGTRLRVTNLANGNVVEVEVVDRGPFIPGRVLDLSRTAARDLDFIRAGHTRVKAEILTRP